MTPREWWALGWRWLLAVVVAIMSAWILVGYLAWAWAGLPWTLPWTLWACYAVYFGALTFARAGDGPSGWRSVVFLVVSGALLWSVSRTAEGMSEDAHRQVFQWIAARLGADVVDVVEWVAALGAMVGVWLFRPRGTSRRPRKCLRKRTEWLRADSEAGL